MNAAFLLFLLASQAQAAPATELRIHTVNLRGDPVDDINVRVGGVVGKSKNGIAAFRIGRIEPTGQMRLVVNLPSADATQSTNSGYVGRIRDVRWNSFQDLASGFVVPLWTERDLNTFASVIVFKPDQYAVAIRFERRSLARPMVVARFAGDADDWSRKVAPDVPAVSMPEFAQSLFGTVFVGQDIPEAFEPDLQKLYTELDRMRQTTQRRLRPTQQDAASPAASAPSSSALAPRSQTLAGPLVPVPQSRASKPASPSAADTRPTLNDVPTGQLPSIATMPQPAQTYSSPPTQASALPPRPYQSFSPSNQQVGQSYPPPHHALLAPCKVVIHNTGSCDFNLQVNTNVVLVRRGEPTVVSVPFMAVTTIIPQQANRAQTWNHWRYAGGEYLLELNARTWTRYRLKREQTVTRLYYAPPPSNSLFNPNGSQPPLRWVPQCEVELTAVAPSVATPSAAMPMPAANVQPSPITYPPPSNSTIR